jgi:hypothetical protein
MPAPDSADHGQSAANTHLKWDVFTGRNVWCHDGNTGRYESVPSPKQAAMRPATTLRADGSSGLTLARRHLYRPTAAGCDETLHSTIATIDLTYYIGKHHLPLAHRHES